MYRHYLGKGSWISPKTLTVVIYWSFGMRFDDNAGHRLNVRPSLTIRPSAGMDVSVGPGLTWFTTETQSIGTFTPDGEPVYVFGPLRQATTSLTARLNYTFNPNLSLQLYAQPFASEGRYDRFKSVADPRAPQIVDRFRCARSRCVWVERRGGFRGRVTTWGAGGVLRVTRDSPGAAAHLRAGFGHRLW